MPRKQHALADRVVAILRLYPDGLSASDLYERLSETRFKWLPVRAAMGRQLSMLPSASGIYSDGTIVTGGINVARSRKCWKVNVEAYEEWLECR